MKNKPSLLTAILHSLLGLMALCLSYRWFVQEATLRTALEVKSHSLGYPARELQRPHREFVFIVDCSGYRYRASLLLSKFLPTLLDADDTFQVVVSGATTRHLFFVPQKPSAIAFEALDQFIDAADIEIGDRLNEALRAATLYPPETGCRRVVAILTDGYLESYGETYSIVCRNRANARFFVCVTDSRSNAMFFDKLAQIGGGKAEYQPAAAPWVPFGIRMFKSLTSVDRSESKDVDCGWLARFVPVERPCEHMGRFGPADDILANFCANVSALYLHTVTVNYAGAITMQAMILISLWAAIYKLIAFLESQLEVC